METIWRLLIRLLVFNHQQEVILEPGGRFIERVKDDAEDKPVHASLQALDQLVEAEVVDYYSVEELKYENENKPDH